jgi:hypothetical protein
MKIYRILLCVVILGLLPAAVTAQWEDPAYYACMMGDLSQCGAAVSTSTPEPSDTCYMGMPTPEPTATPEPMMLETWYNPLTWGSYDAIGTHGPGEVPGAIAYWTLKEQPYDGPPGFWLFFIATDIATGQVYYGWYMPFSATWGSFNFDSRLAGWSDPILQVTNTYATVVETSLLVALMTASNTETDQAAAILFRDVFLKVLGRFQRESLCEVLFSIIGEVRLKVNRGEAGSGIVLGKLMELYTMYCGGGGL